MKKFYKGKSLLWVISSSLVSVLFVAVSTYAATTISTNISTGGTLTVSGASTLSGNVTLGDAATDVNLFTGTLQASTTALFTSGATMYNTLTLYNAASAGTATEGGIYYDSSAKVIKLYDGSAWYTVGTSTDGFNIAGGGDDNRVQFSSLNNFLTLGTTSPSSLSVATLEATSTGAIPLTVRGYTGQTANLLQLHDSSGSELFAIDSAGNASTSMIDMSDGFVSSASSTVDAALTVSGAFRGQGAVTATGLTTLGSASTTVLSTTGNLYVNGVATTSQLNVGGTVTGGTISSIIFGSCTLGQVTVAASSTAAGSCTGATGITTSHKVFVSATSSLHADFIIQAASSSAADTLSVYLYNSGYAGTTTSSIPTTISLNFFGIK